MPARVGPYRVDGRLGVGGMGEVYRGFDERLDRPVALKQVRTDALDRQTALARFRREARTIAKLDHPAVVQVHDWVEDDDGDWFVMELVRGRTLRQLVRRDGPQDPARVLGLGIEIADGLHAAHRLGVIHRDLKPENVMVTSDGRVKILDFGLAKPAAGALDEQNLTGEGKVLGTVSAMSPEQALGNPLDARSDLFALGSLLYELLCGGSPFQGKSSLQVISRICTLPHAPVRERTPATPHVLSELIDHLLEKDPAERPGSAAEVRDRLVEILQRLGDSSGGDPAPGISAPVVPSFSRGPLSAALTGEAEAGKQESALRTEASPPAPAERGDADDLSAILSAPRPASRAGGTGRESGRVSGSGTTLTSERRQVTVVMVDLVTGSQADAELLYELVPDFQSLVSEVLQRYHGHVENRIGHRMVACFGYPLAHGDDARRAVRAGLALVEEMRRHAAESEVAGLGLVVGVHTGTVVVPPGESSEPLVLGATLDVAEAVRGVGESGQVLVSEITHRLVADFFRWETLDGVDARLDAGLEIAGLDAPAAVYLAVESQRDRRRSTGNFVARRRELDLLVERWSLARDGTGQAALISGEPGLGKTRLVDRLGELVRADDPRWLLVQCSDVGGSAPLAPVTELLRRLIGIEDVQDQDEALDRLDDFLVELELPRDEVAPHLCLVLGLPTDRWPDTEISPRLRRERIFEAVAGVFVELAERRPMVLVVEDLQWADPSTVDLVGLLLEQVPTLSCLLVLTARLEFHSAWSHLGHLSQIRLVRLTDEEVADLVRGVAGDPLPEEVREKIVQRADGVPLYAEELTRAVLASGRLREHDGRLVTTGPDPLELPATLRESLTARLDRLGDARATAQLASVMGRSFPRHLLEAVSPLDDPQVEDQLDRLVAGEILLRKGFGRRARFQFRHALLRDAAYESLLRKERRRLHRRVAEFLDRQAVEQSVSEPQVLAYHWQEAGVWDRALEAWRAAAGRALLAASPGEASDHLSHALEAASHLPRGVARDRVELSLLTQLGGALSQARGYSAPELEEVYARAGELAADRPGSPEAFWVHWGLWAFHLVRAEMDRALEHGEQILRRAEEDPDDRQGLLSALAATGTAHYFRGGDDDLETARRYLERGVGLDDVERRGILPSATGQDLGVHVLAALALVLWHAGEEEEALRHSEQALELAERLGHAYTRAFAHAWAARLHQSLGDAEAVHDHAREVVRISREKGFFWITQGLFFLGAARALAARDADAEKAAEYLEDAVRRMNEGLDGYRAAGARLSVTYMLAQIADAERRRGRRAEARALLDEAEDEASRGEGYWLDEIRRLRDGL